MLQSNCFGTEIECTCVYMCVCVRARVCTRARACVCVSNFEVRILLSARVCEREVLEKVGEQEDIQPVISVQALWSPVRL